MIYYGDIGLVNHALHAGRVLPGRGGGRPARSARLPCAAARAGRRVTAVDARPDRAAARDVALRQREEGCRWRDQNRASGSSGAV